MAAKGQCNVEISAEVVQCNDLNNTFNALITVSGTGVGPTFVLGGNGTTFGSFSYSASPIEIGPFSNDGTTYNFAAIDNTTLTCFDETQILPFDECIIACEIDIVDVEFQLCDGLARYANVFIQNSSNVGASFELRVNQVPVGSFLYGEDFYTIGPLTGDCTTGIGVTVIDQSNPDCTDFYWQPGPWCCPDQCIINDVSVTSYCENDEIAGIIVDFNYLGNNNEQFEILVDSIAVDTSFVFEFPDTFFYNFVGQQPDSILQAFGVAHVAKPNCGFYDDYLITCVETPPCSFSDITINPLDCDGVGTYSLELDFEVTSPTSIFFDVFGGSTYLGAFQYADLPITISNFPERDAEFDIITISDNGNDGCAEVLEFIGPDCAELPCIFSNYFIEAHECDSQGLFDMYIQFDVEGEGSEGFIVRGNGIVYDTFEYGEDWYVFGPLEGDCETIFEFILIDVEFPDCQAENGFTEPICCMDSICILSNLIIDDIECNSEELTFSYNFNFNAVTNDSYDIFVDNQLVDTGLYADLSNGADISIPANDIGLYLLTICDNDNPACCVSNAFQGPICSPDCIISDFFIEPQSCNDDGMFFVDLEFNVENPASATFTVFGDGNNYGSFEYGETFYTVGPFVGDCQTVYELIVIDNENQDCTSNFLFIGPICCAIPDCAISELQVDPIECEENGNYFIDLDFEYVGATNDFFDVIVDNEVIAFHALEDLPIEIVYPTSGNEVDVLTICINDNPDCCQIIEFEALDCADSEECFIGEVLAEADECAEDGTFMVDVTFEYENGSPDGFELVGNGISYGIFEYGEDFYTVGPIMADCETILEFIVIDEGDPNCSNFYEFEEAICCDPDACMISDLEAEIISCDSSDQVFFVSISFNIQNQTTQFFEITGNDENYGAFGYGQDSYTLGPLDADGTTFYEFVVTDLEFENCSAVVEFGTVDCMTVSTNDAIINYNITARYQDEMVILDNPDLLQISQFKIFSLEGKYVYGQHSPNNQSLIELTPNIQQNGIYFLSMMVNDQIHTIKLPIFK